MAEETRQQRRARERRYGVRHPVSYSAREVVRIAIGSGGTGLVIGLIGGSFSASGIVSMTVAAIMLAFAWAVGAVAITVSEPVWGLPSRYRLFASLSTILALGIVLGGIGWFQHEHMPIAERGTARLGLKQILQQKFPGESTTNFNVNVQNDGNAIALNQATILAGKLSPVVLPQEQADEAMKKLHRLLSENEKRGPNHVQLAPTFGQIVTLSDIDDITLDPPTKVFINATDSQVKDFNDGKLVLYVFFLSHYEDETIQGHAYWKSEACAYYFRTFVYFHNCGPMTIEKIVGSRFP
jgi:hypothetical protein